MQKKATNSRIECKHNLLMR